MLGRGRLASPGRITDRGTDLKLQRRSWQYDTTSLAVTLPGNAASADKQLLLAIALAGDHCVGGQEKPGKAPTDQGSSFLPVL